VTIEGTDFGTKSPVTPLWWDDGEGAPISTIRILESDLAHVTTTLGVGNRHYVSVWPPINEAVPEYHEMRYEYHNFRNQPGAHQYSTTYLTGGHIENVGAYGNKVGMTVDSLSVKPVWFSMFYYAVDPLWHSCGSGENHKYIHHSDTYAVYSGGDTSYYWQFNSGLACEGIDDVRCHTNQNICGSEHGNMQNLGNCMGSAQNFEDSNPVNDWVHIEERLKVGTGGFINLVHDNDVGYWCTCEDPLSVLYSGYKPRSYTFGGYRAWVQSPSILYSSNDFRYFDDVYLDNTLQRVILCNTDTYPTTAGSSICEPQIPHTTWNSDTIQVTVNLGRLTGETAYLYVFDANNNHNVDGYPITLDEEEFQCSIYTNSTDCLAAGCYWRSSTGLCEDTFIWQPGLFIASHNPSYPDKALDCEGQYLSACILDDEGWTLSRFICE